MVGAGRRGFCHSVVLEACRRAADFCRKECILFAIDVVVFTLLRGPLRRNVQSQNRHA